MISSDCSAAARPISEWDLVERISIVFFFFLFLRSLNFGLPDRLE